MKKSFLWVLVLGTALLLFTASGAIAATVTFSNITDGDLSPLLFDVANTVPTGDGNTLDIGLNNFKADGGGLASLSALDTLSFKITAPEGYYITKVSYYEEGQGQTNLGVSIATGSITAAGIPQNLGVHIYNSAMVGPVPWSLGPGDIPIPGQQQSIDVSLVNSLFATTIPGGADIAWIEKTKATVAVELAQVPIPSAVWLLFSGLACMMGLRKKFKNR